MNKSDFFEPIIQATQFPETYNRTALPDWDAKILKSTQQPKSNDPGVVWDTFCERFKAVNGSVLEGIRSLVDYLQSEGTRKGYLDMELASQLNSPLGSVGIKISSVFDATHIDDYDFGITRAAGIIAETGSIILNETQTSSRLAALAPWIHVAVMDEQTQIYATLLDALSHLGDEPYTVLVTGPSKTADIEGILIEGVHGPGIQVCCKLN
jgi:L-lactate dehydrogenase complex protein LldG